MDYNWLLCHVISFNVHMSDLSHFHKNTEAQNLKSGTQKPKGELIWGMCFVLCFYPAPVIQECHFLILLIPFLLVIFKNLFHESFPSPHERIICKGEQKERKSYSSWRKGRSVPCTGGGRVGFVSHHYIYNKFSKGWDHSVWLNQSITYTGGQIWKRSGVTLQNWVWNWAGLHYLNLTYQ